jgi:nucleoside-diphosphate-sugar epimerase
MKVFLTGASGFIGSAVGKRLLQEGHEVIGVARSDESAAKVESLGMKVYRGDMLQPQSLVEGAKAADAIINCGTALSFEVDRGTVERDAVVAMLEVIKGTGKKFLYTSDQLIYGSTGSEPANEDSPLNPPPFIAWRAALEPVILSYVDHDVHTMIVRPVAVYGHGQDRMMPMLVSAAQQAGFGFYVGDGLAKWSVVHVDDLADLYALMIENASAGTLFVASAFEPVTMKHLAEVAAEIAGTPGQVRGISVEQAQQILGPFAPVQSFMTNLLVSGQKAREELGWQPHRPTVEEEARQGLYAHLVPTFQ